MLVGVCASFSPYFYSEKKLVAKESLIIEGGNKQLSEIMSSKHDFFLHETIVFN